MAERNWVNLASLTNYQVAPDGSSVLLNALDPEGREVSLIVPMDNLQALALTMPEMVTAALRAAAGGDESLRLVHNVQAWKIESASNPEQLIVTFRTPDAFEASFAVREQDLAGMLAQAHDAERNASEFEFH